MLEIKKFVSTDVCMCSCVHVCECLCICCILFVLYAHSECIYHSVDKEAQICCGPISSRIFVAILLLQLKNLPLKTMLNIDHTKEQRQNKWPEVLNILGHGSVKSNKLSLHQWLIRESHTYCWYHLIVYQSCIFSNLIH